jgi:hypothetical protein
VTYPLIAPLGLTPLGLFEDTTTPAMDPPPVIAAEEIDPSTGELVSVFRGIHPVDAQVIEALIRVRGSGASVTSDGHQYTSIQRIDESTPNLVDSYTRRALDRLTRKNDIRIESIAVEVDEAGAWFEVTVSYWNLRIFGAIKPSERKVRHALGQGVN